MVVIFDEDRDDRYQYLTTWLGEHQNESDMAFYATNPFDHLVGPGIGRAEYGGFLMTRPPRRMYDVWGDPDYDFAEGKHERLLMAGLDYSTLPWLHERRIAVLGGDGVNDVLPSRFPDFGPPVHRIGIPGIGLHLVDNADLERLSETCARLHRWEFLVTIAPWVLRGGTGSPVNPIAVF